MVGQTAAVARCPRCASQDVSDLQRLQPEHENSVLRCRTCGRLWSPKEPSTQLGPLLSQRDR